MATPKISFKSSENEGTLVKVLYKDFQRRTGGNLTRKQMERLEKTVHHYMDEVYEELGDKPTPVLNKEVLQEVVKDYSAYLRRSELSENATVTPEDRIRTDVGSRFSQLQTERQDARPLPPAAPDFRISIDDGASTALSLFEQVKKQREDDAVRITASSTAVNQPRLQAEINESVEASITFGQTSDAAKKRDELALVERSLMRQAASQKQVNLSLPPDPRAFFFGNSQGVPSGQDGSGLAQTNPTTALPDSIRTRPVLPQDIIKKQDDVVSYRENEYNLFLYSSDRNWTVNNTENRYNFSVNFDPANNRSGFGFSTAANIKFKNIVRIELVKTIVPAEGLEIVPTQPSATGQAGIVTDMNINALSFPYLMLRIPELDTNNFGTNNNIDTAFGVVQYDATWVSDTTAKNRGYIAMIPKFMKCQKVFYPTPLSTLQKLSIQIQRPDGNLVSDALDTIDITAFLFSSQLGSQTATTYYSDSGSVGSYIWINTTTWFSKFMVSQGDRIIIKNIVFPSSFTITAASTDFLNYIQRASGHIVIDVATGKSGTYTTGANIVGYCNYIIIKNNYGDPTTGNTVLSPYGGSQEADIAFRSVLINTVISSGRLINMNHQTQVVLRVITRDMDSATHLRPDNNF